MSDHAYEERSRWGVLANSLLDNNRNRAWFKKNEQALLNELKQRGKIDPKNIFTVHDPHTYVELKEDVPRDEEFYAESSDFTETKEITTGYLKPHFRYAVNEIVADDYEKLIDRLSLEKGGEVSLDKVPIIESFDKLIYSQYDRQLLSIFRSNRLIAEELGVLYSVAEQSILRSLKSSDQKVPYEKPPEGWTELVLNLRSFFNKIQLETSPRKIEEQKAFDLLNHHNYVDSNLINEISDKINAIYSERQSYIISLRKLTRQILPLESIKNDIVFNRELRSVKMVRREEAYRDMPDPASYAQIITGPNKDPAGSDVEMTTRALIELRDYLLDKQITENPINVSEIEKELRKRTQDLDKSTNTIRSWIERYFKKYQKNRKERLNNL